MEADDVWLLLCAHHLAVIDRQLLLTEALREYELQLEWRRLMRPRHYLTCVCLDNPSESAWAKLYRHGTDLNFINATSLTRRSFENLVSVFAPHYQLSARGPNGGRPPKLQSHQEVLGLLLYFYVSSMDQASMCIAFGVPPATTSRILRRAENALAIALRTCQEARIAWPSSKRQKELASLVAAREPLLQFTFGFIDGKNFKVQEPSASNLQNAMYNGWLHSVFVTGTICFAADGCIIWCRHNCPGSWNDAENSGGFFNNLLDTSLCPDQRYGVVADSAFPCSASMVGRILTPLKDGDLERLVPSRRSKAMQMHNAITSVRQAAEWGMGSIGKVYRRLRMPLPYDPQVRGIRLENIFRLSNFRVRTVEISQIRTTFAEGVEFPDYT